MPDHPGTSPSQPIPGPPSPAEPADQRTRCGPDKTLCERCDAEMYRMHAVWRCPACGFKTDCCGW